MKIYKYGPSKLSLKYKDDELSMLIEKFMGDNVQFSFSQLCNNVLILAEQNNMLEKEPNTSYSQILLSNVDAIRICKMLWEHIWNKKLILLFKSPQDMYMNRDDTYFVVTK